MSFKMGIDGKLYVCAAGIAGSPVWTEVDTAKDVTLNLADDAVDLTTRAGGGWKLTGQGLRDAGVEFSLPWDPDNAAFAILWAAFIGRDAVGVACMDGDITTSGSEGLWADMAVVSFTRDESMAGEMMANISIKPTRSDNAPAWTTI